MFTLFDQLIMFDPLVSYVIILVIVFFRKTRWQCQMYEISRQNHSTPKFQWLISRKKANGLIFTAFLFLPFIDHEDYQINNSLLNPSPSRPRSHQAHWDLK